VNANAALTHARKVPRSGGGIASLYERTDFTASLVAAGRILRRQSPTTALTQVVNDLGLKPLSAEDEEEVRAQIGHAIWAWQDDRGTSALNSL
jgi:hypothetical protein